MSNNNSLIIIPARFGSTRFPGKPLAKIAGKTLLQRVCEAAQLAAQQLPNVDVLVATDDDRIIQHANELGVQAVHTPESCPTGTDRAIAAVMQMEHKPKYVVNLQGDAPLTPVAVISALLDALQHHPVVTPVMQLSWADLDVLRKTKQTTPFSGTSAILSGSSEAIWFSKNIIPAIRTEEKLRSISAKSPVFQHLGVYGYSTEMLQTFARLPQGHYEQLEGLEQLRWLENGYKIHAVQLELKNLNAWRGVDTLEDAKFVEQIILAGTN